jgi:hypothetical protein
LGYVKTRGVKNMSGYRDLVTIDNCTKCHKTSTLVVHHMDYNRENNVVENLLVLCWSCHQKLHSDSWKLEDIGLKTPYIKRVLMPWMTEYYHNSNADIQRELEAMGDPINDIKGW